MNLVQRLARVVNAAVRPLVASPRWGGPVGGWMAVVSYTGRRSGRTFSIPVGYTRRGDDLTIPVELPGQKTWWRNFLGDDGPIAVRLRGVDRSGHAVANRDDTGQVTGTVHLEPAASPGS
jgi:hypothetical protein